MTATGFVRVMDGQADAAVDPWVPNVIVRALGRF
jgi:hypothetical protein